MNNEQTNSEVRIKKFCVLTSFVLPAEILMKAGSLILLQRVYPAKLDFKMIA